MRGEGRGAHRGAQEWLGVGLEVQVAADRRRRVPVAEDDGEVDAVAVVLPGSNGLAQTMKWTAAVLVDKVSALRDGDGHGNGGGHGGQCSGGKGKRRGRGEGVEWEG